MSSDEDGAALMAAFKRNGDRNFTAAPLEPPKSVSPRDSMSDDGSLREESTASTPRTQKAICVRASPVRNRHDYTYYEPKDEVDGILREFTKRGEMLYEVRLWSDKTKVVSGISLADEWGCLALASEVKAAGTRGCLHLGYISWTLLRNSTLLQQQLLSLHPYLTRI